MKKYDYKLIIDYVNGNDIENYDIEELENDCLFMMQVIFYANDKNMYKLCSDELKHNFKFVKFIIDKFHDDIKFIDTVANNFISNSTDVLEQLEITLIILEYLESKKEEYDELYYKYRMISTMIAENEINSIEFFKVHNEDEKEILEVVKMGFCFIIDDYNGNKKACDFFAKKFFDEIFYENHDLEKIVHLQFRTYEELEEYGINNFLVNYLMKYDNYLAEYVKCNIDVLDYLKKYVNSIKKNWNNYNKRQEVKCYILLLDIIEKYINENNCNFEYFEILEIFGKEFGVLDKIKEYLGIFYGYNTYENFTNDFSNEEDCLVNSDVNDEVDAVSLYNIIDKKHIEWCDLKDYYAIRRIMIDILKARDLDVIEEKYNDYLESGKIKTKKR